MKKKEIADEYLSYKVRATTNICIDIVYPTRKLCSSIHMMHGVYHFYLNVLVGLWAFKTNFNNIYIMESCNFISGGNLSSNQQHATSHQQILSHK